MNRPLTLEDDSQEFTRKSPEELQAEKDDLTIQNMFEEIKRLTLENDQLKALNEAKTVELIKYIKRQF